ncbi:MAG TPA: metalloregulator ArsR/SmtB family transcription factor [Miltoncostaeaceae bacterium]|nr:metalloregulator ArsR/SmtB family transcription factor [Miltoncostaeaceae bacterium]
MSVPHPLPEQLAEIIAERFRVLSEPMRIRILDTLRDNETTVGDLAHALDASQQNISKHLGVLARAGLVEREKHGTAVRCRVADDSVFALCELVCGDVSRQLDKVRSLLETQEASS